MPDSGTYDLKAGRSQSFRSGSRLTFRVTYDKTLDGGVFCQRAIDRIRSNANAGRRSVVVFDIDNTLVDTRYRTLAVVRQFGIDHEIPELARVEVDELELDGRKTGEKLGLSGTRLETLQVKWREVFWAHESFEIDPPISASTERCHQARAAGADIYYITGRKTWLHETTKRQLARIGVPQVDDTHVICKPEGQSTAPYKVERLRGLLAQGYWLGWFLTEEKRDIAHIQRQLPDVPCVWLDFPILLPGHDIAADTPILAFR